MRNVEALRYFVLCCVCCVVLLFLEQSGDCEWRCDVCRETLWSFVRAHTHTHTHCFKVTEQEGNVTTGNSLTITPSDPVCVSEWVSVCVCVCVCVRVYVGFLPWGRMHIIYCTIPHIMSSGCIALYVVSHTHTHTQISISARRAQTWRAGQVAAPNSRWAQARGCRGNKATWSWRWSPGRQMLLTFWGGEGRDRVCSDN